MKAANYKDPEDIEEDNLDDEEIEFEKIKE